MTTLLSTPNWEHLRLVKALEGNHSAALKRVYDFVAPLLETRPLGLEEFTDHNLRHSARVVERIGYILPGDVQLNQSELYLLLLAALLHDAGLWTSKAEAGEVFQSLDFRAYCRKWSINELEVVDRLLNDPKQRFLGELGVQRLVALYHRDSHADRLGRVV